MMALGRGELVVLIVFCLSMCNAHSYSGSNSKTRLSTARDIADSMQSRGNPQGSAAAGFADKGVNRDSADSMQSRGNPLGTAAAWFAGKGINRDIAARATSGQTCLATCLSLCGDHAVNTCPSGYFESTHGFCLSSTRQTMSQSDAESMCQTLGGHLMNIDTAERWDDFTEWGSKYINPFSVWIDGTRSVTGGAWTYASGTNPATNGVNHWHPQEPSNGIGELCKVVDFDDTWNDRDCGREYASMCEFRVPETQET